MAVIAACSGWRVAGGGGPDDPPAPKSPPRAAFAMRSGRRPAARRTLHRSPCGGKRGMLRSRWLAVHPSRPGLELSRFRAGHMLIQAASRSQAQGLFQPKAESLRRGL
jgi:hypothetical protein